jgi:hypothetical protein
MSDWMRISNFRQFHGTLVTLAIGAGLMATSISCSPIIGHGQATEAQVDQVLEGSTRIGQNIRSRNAGLTGVDVFLAPHSSGNGSIRLRLMASRTEPRVLASADLNLNNITRADFRRFTFPTQPESYLVDYHLELQLIGSGKVAVGSGSANSYLDGAMYVNGQSVDRQLCFQLVYEPTRLAMGLARQSLIWLFWLGVALAAFVLPGWALLMALWPRVEGLVFWGKLGLAAGVGMGIYPVLLLWSNLFGLHLGKLNAWIPLVTSLIYLLYKYLRRNQHAQSHPLPLHGANVRSSWSHAAMIVILAAVVLSRFWIIRTVAVPMWGDSYQHAVITQLIIDHGGLFSSWQPYSELGTLSYHFGFHSLAAVLHWLTGLDTPQAVLVTGQLLNVLAVLSVYPLATLLGTASPWCGVLAVYIAGLLSPMPAYYANWGRYTQLAGQVMLPALVCLIWLFTKESGWSRKKVLLLSLLVAGLFLTHYRVFIFFLLFLPGLGWKIIKTYPWRKIIPVCAGIIATASVLVTPWVPRLLDSRLTGNAVEAFTQRSSPFTDWIKQADLIWPPAELYPPWFWLLSCALLLYGFWRRSQGPLQMTVWFGMLLLAANPQWLNLPGQGTMTNLAVFIAGYLAAAIIMADGVVGVSRIVSGKLRSWIVATVFLGLAAIMPILVRQRINDFQPQKFTLASIPDVRAGLWVRENTDPKARFLVNSFFTFGKTVIVGSDGGWWLPLLGRRESNLPPLTYSFERGVDDHFLASVKSLWDTISVQGINSKESLKTLRDRRFTHIYIGQLQGRVGYSGPAVLDPAILTTSPYFEKVYHEDCVWIFRIKYPPELS